MSSFGWRHFIAVGLALAASTVLWLSLKPREPDLPFYKYGQGSKADYRAGGSGCEPNVLAFIRDEREALRERERCEKEAEDHHLQRADLVQQTRAANAAEAQAEYAFEQTRIGVLQTIGGFLTLLAAVAAAFYAGAAAQYTKIAATETKRSADQAEVANTLASRNFVAAQRAWIKVDLEANLDFTFFAGESKFGVFIIIENIGSTPAVNVQVFADLVRCFEYSHAVELVSALAGSDIENIYDHNVSILPGQILRIRCILSIKDKETIQYSAICPIEYFAVIGCVTYKIAGDDSTHQTAFAYMLSDARRRDADSPTAIVPALGDIPAEEIEFKPWEVGFAT